MCSPGQIICEERAFCFAYSCVNECIINIEVKITFTKPFHFLNIKFYFHLKKEKRLNWRLALTLPSFSFSHSNFSIVYNMHVQLFEGGLSRLGLLQKVLQWFPSQFSLVKIVS